MKPTTSIPIVAALPAGCANVVTVPAPSTGDLDGVTPMTRLVETRGSAPTGHEIPESERIAWFEAHRPPPPPPRVRVERERVVVREREPVRYERRPYCYDDWALPVSFSLGWWGGHWGRHHGHGWGVGLDWRDRWWW